MYDPVEEEVVIGATCTLSGKGVKATTTTDDFGDFYFEGLGEGVYALEIKAAKFKAKAMDGISTVESVNLGDIPLAK